MKASIFTQKALRFADRLSAADDVVLAEALRLFTSALRRGGLSSVASVVAGVQLKTLPSASRGEPAVADVRSALKLFRSSLSAQDKRNSARDFKAIENLISGRDSGSLSSLVESVSRKFALNTQPRDKRKPSVDQVLIEDFLTRLKSALGDPDAFKAIFDELEAHPGIGQPEAVAIAKSFMGRTAANTSRKAALERIWSRHAALMDFRAKRKSFGGRTAA